MQPFNNKLEINCQNGNLSTNGTIYYGELTQQSSKMFKTNIQTISDEIIGEIFNINGKMYIKNNQNEIGLILEELLDNCPLLSKYLASYLEINELNPEIKSKIDNKYIITKNNKKYVPYGIKYTNIIPLLLEIIKRQRDKINKLEKQINNILENHEQLIKTIDTLKQNMNLLLQNQNIQTQRTTSTKKKISNFKIY